jgi:hypothetical protein
MGQSEIPKSAIFEVDGAVLTFPESAGLAMSKATCICLGKLFRLSKVIRKAGSSSQLLPLLYGSSLLLNIC